MSAAQAIRVPRICAHFAMTADGKISTKNLTPSRFTSPSDKSRLHLIRAENDAILAGRGTVEADTMTMGLSRLDLREERVRQGRPPEPLRVVISNEGIFNPASKIFSYTSSSLLVLSTIRMPQDVRDAISPHCDLLLFDTPTVPLRKALAMLRRDYAVKRLVCEGGGQLLRALAAEDLLDEIRLTIAPVIFGGSAAPSLTGLPSELLPEPRFFSLAKFEVSEGECALHYIRERRKR